MKRRYFIKLICNCLPAFLLGSLQRSDKLFSEMARAPSEDNLTLFLSGDVMTGRGIDQALPHSVDPELHEPYVKDARYYLTLAERQFGDIPDNLSYKYIWGDALDVLENMNTDANIINLETAVTSSENYWQDKNIHYRMHPQNAQLLNAAAIDVCVLANNHMLDWGHNGLRETLALCTRGALKQAGPEVMLKPPFHLP